MSGLVRVARELEAELNRVRGERDDLLQVAKDTRYFLSLLDERGVEFDRLLEAAERAIAKVEGRGR